MSPPPPNYYEILGVSPDADEKEIKRAYRSLSLQYHPDRNDDPEAEAKMQDINRAYEAIGNPEERDKYDFQLQHGFNKEEGGGFPADQDIHNIFNMMFGSSMMGGMGGGGGPNIRIFHNGFGGGGGGFHSFMRSPEPLQLRVPLTLLQAYNGCNIPITVERTITNILENSTMIEIDEFYIQVPQGIDTKEIMIIGDKGNVVIVPNRGEVKGELRVSFDITEKDENFQRKGMDLFFVKTITLKDSLCGFSFEINHLNGKRYHINNYKNVIHPEYKKIIPHLGMLKGSQSGSLHISFTIVFPERLEENQVEALNNILS